MSATPYRLAGADVAASEPATTWRLLHSGASAHAEGLAHQGLRNRSQAVLEALVSASTGGRHDAASLLRTVLDNGPPAVTLAPGRVRTLTAVATVWAGWQRSHDELQGAATVFDRLLEGGPADHLTAEHHTVAAQTLFLAGRYDALARTLPRLDLLSGDLAHYLRVDLAHPVASGADHDPARWRYLLGASFVDSGLEAVTVTDDDDTVLFDRLSAVGARPASAGGDLVTVVMPCYRPDRGLVTSVRSITSQTWSDLEILVVDDASGPAYADLFAEVASLDPRVQVLTMERNGGSYLARDAAIARSRGRWVTFQDADDWSHPRRIEHQVAALAGSDAPMSRSRAVRAKDDLTHQWLGYRPTRPNASSLLVRREVFERWGGFIPVRKGADSEFAERVEVLVGPVVDTHTPLAVTRLRFGSLSRGDFTYSWMAPDRLTFRGAFGAWHRRLRERRAAGEDLPLTPEDLARLPFAVPLTYTRGLPTAQFNPTRLTTAYLGNFSRVRPTQGSLWLRDALEAAPSGPGPAGIWSQEPAWDHGRRRPQMANGWFDLIHRHGTLRPICRTDAVHVDRLVVVDAEVLALMTGQECRVSADQVDLWLTPELVEPDGSLLPADLLGLADACAVWFGVRPHWVLAPHLEEPDRDRVLGALPGLEIDEAAPVTAADEGRS